jgi:hypothetical protein
MSSPACYKSIFLTAVNSAKSKMQSTDPSSFTMADLGSFPYEIRQELLDGPTPLLVAFSTCEPFDYTHQCSAAKGMVSPDRMRQFVEQSESNTRPFAIEFPARALAFASPSFKQNYDLQPGIPHVPLHMDNVLPGYAMCVLDWYGRALQKRNWNDFLPDDLPTETSDRWYWFYCYAAMRLLGMEEFAAQLHGFIRCTLRALITDRESYAHLLRSLSREDPIVSHLAHITARQMKSNTLMLTDVDKKMLAEHFPHFAVAVEAIINSDQ